METEEVFFKNRNKKKPKRFKFPYVLSESEKSVLVDYFKGDD